MFARLILALFVMLATPAAVATPACHGAMPEMAGHHDPKPAKAMPAEALCVGCIAPATVHPPVIEHVRAPVTLPPPVRALSGLRLALTPPATPPPRMG